MYYFTVYSMAILNAFYYCFVNSQLIKTTLMNNLSFHDPICMDAGRHVATLKSLIPKVLESCDTSSFSSAHFTLNDGSNLLLTSRTCLFTGTFVSNVTFKSRCPGLDSSDTLWDLSIRFVHPYFAHRDQADYSLVPLTSTKRVVAKRNSNIFFEKLLYEVTVDEEQPPYQSVAVVVAHSSDKLPLLYSMIALEDGRSINYFRMNRTSGVIETTSRLDRETIPFHVFRVYAFDASNTARSASATARINVRDINDHAPRFERSVYVGTVSEDVVIGTTVLIVHASDADEHENGALEYTMENSAENHVFSLNADTGLLSVRGLLDRERHAFYRLTVVASDKAAEPSRRKGIAIAEITVNDVNDNAPQFAQSRYTVDVLENLDYSHQPVILTVQATDTDSGDNAKIRYSFISGNRHSCFSIDYETGAISVVCQLKWDRQYPSYELVVRAQDAGTPRALSSRADVIINILDTNDNAPKFFSAQYQEVVPEDSAIGHRVLQLQAYDTDEGANAELTYRMLEEPSPNLPFAVDAHTGWLSVHYVLDRERKSEYQFQVMAVDGGQPPLSSLCSVTINVNDVNDENPAFPMHLYNITVPEDARPGTELLRIRAIDKDDADYVEYSITGGNDGNVFQLSTQHGFAVITLQGVLDFRKVKLYNLYVKAADRTGKFDKTLVAVHVGDVNSAPYFERHPISVSLMEGEPAGYTVLVLQAYDQDEGDNAQLTYSLVGPSANYFSVEDSTGTLTLAQPLDRERIARHKVMVSVTDHGSPPKTDLTELDVIVEDINDNTPQFLKTNYTFDVSEDVFLQTSVGDVSAQDADLGENARVIYALQRVQVHGNAANVSGSQHEDVFLVDPSSGTIRVTKPLDRELVDIYVLTVVATDQGKPKLSSSALVVFNVVDVNDNPPVFEQTSYKLFIAENSPLGSVVGRLLATDKDTGKNALVTYKIFGGQDMGAFELRSTSGVAGAELLTRTELDYESKKNSYELHVQAMSGERSTIVEVFVFVLDRNDHPPQLKDFFIVFNNFRSGFPLHELGRIPAQDPDVNDTLHYSIVRGNEAGLLYVDARTGKLRLSSSLNTNRRISAIMKVCVSDGANTVCAACTLRVVLVTDDMLLNSVTIRVEGATPEALLNRVEYSKFVVALASLVPAEQDDVVVFSVRQDDEVTNRLVLNVSFSIRWPHSGRWLSADELRELVYINRKALEDLTGLTINEFQDAFCVREPCPNFERCQTSLKFSNASDFIITDSFLFRPIYPDETFSCRCPVGFAGMNKSYTCDVEVNLCYSSPCGPNATCISKEGGYTCVCPGTHTGKHCEYPLLGSFCLPNICQGGAVCSVMEGSQELTCRDCRHPVEFSNRFCQLRARSFMLGSFLALSPIRSRNRFKLSISFATIAANGLLLYNGRYQPEHDFIALQLVDGQLKFSFSLGGAQSKDAVLELDNNLNDGQFHTVIISYHSRTATVSVDDCDVEVAVQRGREIGYKNCAVRVTDELADACGNVSVACNRFLDLNGPLYLGGLPDRMAAATVLRTRAFEGCIRDVIVDDALRDLGNYVVNHKSEAGCKRLYDRCTESSPCENARRCWNVWDGYRCECKDGFGGRNCTERHSPQPLRLLEEDSFARWSPDALSFNASDSASFPLYVGASFRTLGSSSGSMMAVTFSSGWRVFVQMDRGRLIVSVNESSKEDIPSGTTINDGQWQSLQLVFTKDYLNASLNFLTIKTIMLEKRLSGTFSDLVIGKSAGMGKSLPGCIKNVHATPYVQYHHQADHMHHVSVGCNVRNPCVSNPCPMHSTCVQQWDAFQCRCHSGYFGKQCEDVCSSKLNPCRNKASCMRTATGYRCACLEGYTGQYCETKLPAACPKAWWGFPICGPCRCDTTKGFDAACDQANGACRCKSNHYQPFGSERCLPCNCFYPRGSESGSCDVVSGQCPCRGDVRGRTCDSCDNPRAKINESGYCEVVRGACPEQYVKGVLWPTTAYGYTATTLCPKFSTGFAERRCTASDLWLQPNMYNCTSNRFKDLDARLNELDAGVIPTHYVSQTLAAMLANATTDELPLYGRDIYIAYRLLMAVLRRELELTGLELTHNRDSMFLKHVVSTAGHILAPQHEHWWHVIMQGAASGETQRRSSFAGANFLQTFAAYGRHLSQQFLATYMEPFQIVEQFAVFAVDKVHPGTPQLQLPKYDNFLAPVAAPIPYMPLALLAAPKGTAARLPVLAVYASFPSLGAVMPHSCDDNVRDRNYPIIVNSPIFSVELFDQHSLPITQLDAPLRLTLPLLGLHNVTNPRCAFWQTDNAGRWSVDGCAVSGRNDTHVFCSCTHLSSFAVLMDLTENTYIIARDGLLAYVGPAAVVCCCVMVGATILARVFARDLRSCTNSILRAIFGTFLLAVLTFACVTVARDHLHWCRTVSVLLHFCYVSLFAWLFLLAVHVYRCMVDMKDLSHASVWLYCIVAWGAPCLIVALTAALSPNSHGHTDFCWFRIQDHFIWAMSGPAAVFSTFTIYVGGMCLVVVFSKHWELVTPELRRHIACGLVLFVAAVLHWVLAVLSVNLQLLALHYAYVALTIFFAIFVFLAYFCFDKNVRLWLGGLCATTSERTVGKLNGKTVPGLSAGIVEPFSSTYSSSRNASPPPPPAPYDGNSTTFHDNTADDDGDSCAATAAADDIELERSRPLLGAYSLVASPFGDAPGVSSRERLDRIPCRLRDCLDAADLAQPDVIPFQDKYRGQLPPEYASLTAKRPAPPSVPPKYSTLSTYRSPLGSSVSAASYTPIAQKDTGDMTTSFNHYATQRRRILSPAPAVLRETAVSTTGQTVAVAPSMAIGPLAPPSRFPGAYGSAFISSSRGANDRVRLDCVPFSNYRGNGAL